MSKKIITRSNGSRRVQKIFDKEKFPSKTQQHLRHEVDTKKIMERYLKTGTLPANYGVKKPQYGDFTDVNYFRDMYKAKAKVSQLVETFDNLHPELQEEFGSPEKFVEYLSDKKNHKEAIKLGLIKDYLPENLDNSSTSANPPKSEPVQTEIPGTEKK